MGSGATVGVGSGATVGSGVGATPVIGPSLEGATESDGPTDSDGPTGGPDDGSTEEPGADGATVLTGVGSDAARDGRVAGGGLPTTAIPRSGLVVATKPAVKATVARMRFRSPIATTRRTR